MWAKRRCGYSVNEMLTRYRDMSEKTRIVFRNTLGAFVVRGMALCLSLFTLPAYMAYFSDQEVLGVWYTLLSVLTWVLNFDLGIGNGLRNKLTHAIAGKDYSLAKRLVSSAYVMSGSIALVFLLLGVGCSCWVDWNALFNVSSALVVEDALLFAVRCAFVSISLQFFLRLISSILYALQMSAINNLIAFVSNALQLLFVITAPKTSSVQSLQVFSVVHILTSNLPLLVASIYVFTVKLRQCSPQIRFFRKEQAKEVLSLGGLFFFCQIMYMIIMNTNEFVVARYFSPTEVVDYQIYNKLFMLPGTIIMMALTPLWSVVSKAMSDKDYVWLRKTYRILECVSVVALVAEFAMVPILKPILHIWLGENAIEIDYVGAACFAFFGASMIIQTMVSTFTNGLSRIKIQAACYGIGVCFKFIFIHYVVGMGCGWNIIVIANALILFVYSMIQHFDMRRLLKSLV